MRPPKLGTRVRCIETYETINREQHVPVGKTGTVTKEHEPNKFEAGEWRRVLVHFDESRMIWIPFKNIRLLRTLELLAECAE